MGRWMSPDWSDKPEDVPYADLENPQSLNLYGYVNNNPLTHADADGHVAGVDDAIEVVTLGVIAGAAVIAAYEQTPAGQRSIETLSSAASNNFVSDVKSVKETVTGWFSSKATAPAGPKAADAPTVTANGQAANPKTGEKLGPSKNEVGHSTTHNTKKGAKEAAARKSKDGKVRNDANPKDGRGGHFHPNDTDNEGSDHHYYPKKNNP